MIIMHTYVCVPVIFSTMYFPSEDCSSTAFSLVDSTIQPLLSDSSTNVTLLPGGVCLPRCCHCRVVVIAIAGVVATTSGVFYHHCYYSAVTASAAAIAIALSSCESSHLQHEPAHNKTAATNTNNHNTRLLLCRNNVDHPHTPHLSSLHYAACHTFGTHGPRCSEAQRSCVAGSAAASWGSWRTERRRDARHGTTSRLLPPGTDGQHRASHICNAVDTYLCMSCSQCVEHVANITPHHVAGSHTTCSMRSWVRSKQHVVHHVASGLNLAKSTLVNTVQYSGAEHSQLVTAEQYLQRGCCSLLL